MSIERALNRHLNQIAAKNDQRRFEPPILCTQDDIVRLLNSLVASPVSGKQEQVATVIKGTDGAEQNVVAHVTDFSQREMLLAGFELIRARQEAKQKEEPIPIEVNGRKMLPPSVIADDAILAIDTFIHRTLGATREGDKLVWNLQDGYNYYYDPLNNKLFAEKRE